MVSRAANANMCVRSRPFHLPSRYWLFGSGIAGFLLTFIVIVHALYAYDNAYRFFLNFTQDDKAKIED